MGRKLYIGNLPYSINQQMLQDAFGECGTVDSVQLITDRETGQSKGFAFLEMSSSGEAQRAIQQLNGSTLGDREIRVNEARPEGSQNRRKGGSTSYGRRYR